MARVTEKNVGLGERISQGISGAMQGAKQGFDMAQAYENSQRQAEKFALEKQQIKQQMSDARHKAEEVSTQQWGDFLVNMSQAKKPEEFLNVNAARANQLLQYVPGGSKMNQEQIVEYAKHMQSNLSEPIQQLDKSKATIMSLGSSDQAVRAAYELGGKAVAQIKSASPYETYPTWDSKKNVLDQLMEKRFGGDVQLKAAETAAGGAERKAANKSAEDLDKEARKEMTLAENVITGVATRGTNSMFGQTAKRAFGGRLLDNMMDKIDNPKVPESEKIGATKQVALTLARNFESTIAQGGASAEFAKHMVPESFEGTAAEFWQKVSGSPQKYLTTDFLKNFANEIKVERDTVTQDMGQMISSKYDSLKNSYGPRWSDQFKATAEERFRKDKFMANALKATFAEKAGKADQQTAAQAAKKPVKKLYSESRNQTKLIYADGSEEIVDGQK